MHPIWNFCSVCLWFVLDTLFARMWQRSNKPSQCEARQTETGSYCYLPCGENIHVANIIQGHYDKMGNNEAFKVIRLMEKETWPSLYSHVTLVKYEFPSVYLNLGREEWTGLNSHSNLNIHSPREKNDFSPSYWLFCTWMQLWNFFYNLKLVDSIESYCRETLTCWFEYIYRSTSNNNNNNDVKYYQYTMCDFALQLLFTNAAKVTDNAFVNS
jgi:hypothetical protein